MLLKISRVCLVVLVMLCLLPSSPSVQGKDQDLIRLRAGRTQDPHCDGLRSIVLILSAR